ncbi:MAG: hypothetical protein ACREGF_04960, partial [Candidatus Saccharimonadales bacterium]
MTEDKTVVAMDVDDYVLSPEFTKLKPTQKALAGLSALSKEYELHVLTGRPDMAAASTREWLNLHFPNIFVSASFSNLFNKKKWCSKGEMWAEIGAQVLIDDNLSHLISAQPYG